ncbi:LysR family transcriptional regulator [Nocardia stercoris]|uniref:LysR family transcriptional regulator n=1 Tax=Nocardia stercoris TaxID=2483361 RepID=A0A3M2L5T8_9NOCA|nr:LysR family transcriptional regulator [Nocardia stercoris]RMI32346.1 LysR family transcriptional regulator [Nocardia stercoris]
MELQQMRYVIAIAETNSFTRAAERCRVVQSALSHQIARLERELGAKLFERTSRRVRLTPAGAAFLPAARQCLDAADRAAAEVAAAAGEIRGRLAVGLIPTVAAVDVPATLAEFRSHHPQVRISLCAGASEDLAEKVRSGTIDIAFLGLPTTARPQGVRSHVLAHDHLVAVVAPDHPLAAESVVDLSRLSTEVFVDLPAGTAGRAQADQAFAAAGLTRDVAFEVTTAYLINRLVEQRLAIAMLASAYVPQLTGLATIEVANAPTRVEHIVWSRDGHSPAAAAFLEILGIPSPPEDR